MGAATTIFGGDSCRLQIASLTDKKMARACCVRHLATTHGTIAVLRNGDMTDLATELLAGRGGLQPYWVPRSRAAPANPPTGNSSAIGALHWPLECWNLIDNRPVPVMSNST